MMAFNYLFCVLKFITHSNIFSSNILEARNFNNLTRTKTKKDEQYRSKIFSHFDQAII
jgi:hypothetical protein